eukprot:51303-Pleurochrysis_carterae.AAC.1
MHRLACTRARDTWAGPQEHRRAKARRPTRTHPRDHEDVRTSSRREVHEASGGRRSADGRALAHSAGHETQQRTRRDKGANGAKEWAQLHTRAYAQTKLVGAGHRGLQDSGEK